MAGKRKTMSLSIDPELYYRVRAVADRNPEANLSRVVTDLVRKYLGTVEDDTVTPIVLKLPNHLRGKPEELRAWLDGKSFAIVQALS